MVLGSLAIMKRHNLNATDAAILSMLIHQSAYLAGGPASVLLVASDHRLVRAAGAEGFQTLNPEQVAAIDVPSIGP